MKIIASAYSIDFLKLNINKADGFVLGNNEFSMSLEKSFSLEELIIAKEYLKEQNKIFILNLDFIATDKMLNSLKVFLTNFLEDTLFLVADLGVYKILNDLKLFNKSIYYPRTLITNYADFNAFIDLGFKMVSPALEIPISDIKLINDKSNNQMFFKAFGRNPMFVSKRRLISLYNTKMNSNIKTYDISLKEENRNELYPVTQNEHGTICYCSFVYNAFDYIDIIKDFNLLFLDNITIKEEAYQKVIDIYFNYFNNTISKEEGLKELNSLDLCYEGSFLDHDTLYVKEKASR